MAERDEDAALPRELLERLLAAFAPRSAPAPRAGLLDEIVARARADSALPPTLRADAPWRLVAPGFAARTLHDDGRYRTWVARLARGAAIPAHVHADGDEQCLVLEGEIEVDGELMRGGDFRVARQGTRHDRVVSREGCVLLLRTPSPARP